MKKNQLTTTRSAELVLGRSKILMGITKKILEGKNKSFAKTKTSQKLILQDDITIIGSLMWEDKSQIRMKWDDAIEYAKNLRLGGYDDWRLPTIEELSEIVTLCGGTLVNYDYHNWNKVTRKNIANVSYRANY